MSSAWREVMAAPVCWWKALAWAETCGTAGISTAHAPRQVVLPDEAERERGHRRAEHVSDHRDQHVGDEHRPEAGEGVDAQGAGGQHGQRDDDHTALPLRGVDRGADRRLHGETEPSAQRRDEAHLGLAPMLLRDEEDVQIGPERPAHIGEQEIDGVERATTFCDRRHSHIHNVPSTSVMAVSGAPTRK